MKNNRIAVWLVIMLVWTMLFTGCGSLEKPVSPAAAQSPQMLTVNVIDVGQGDAILVQTNEQVVLIDSGDVSSRKELVAFLKEKGISSIDKVIISHPHADHLGGMAAVLAHFTVKQVYDSGLPATTALYRNYLSMVKQQNIPFTVLAAGDRLEFGRGVTFQVLGPAKPFIAQEELNNNSIIGKLVFGQFSMLFTGDAEKQAEDRLRKQYLADLPATVLKSPHHGSKTSSSMPFLRAVAPEAVIISAGAGNEYQHPHKATLKKYANVKSAVYRTDLSGTITVTSDGKSYQIIKERQ